MKTLRLTIRPLSAFGTAPKGDTLFGQLCWVLRDGVGEKPLAGLLEDYTAQQPFAVVSDLLPHAYVPRPDIPLSFFQQDAEANRKAVKKQVWLPLPTIEQPVEQWLAACKNPQQVLANWQSQLPDDDKTPEQAFVSQHIRQHNSLNRSTGTTGTGEDGFAPYALNQIWYAQETLLDLYVVYDEARIDAILLQDAFSEMGQFGFGRDATVGLGKFSIISSEDFAFRPSSEANATLTLAPCAPQGLGYDAERSYYQLFTRFGRHGGQAVQSGRPFKTPVMLAQTGAVFSGGDIHSSSCFIGQGVGGVGPDGQGFLSRQIPQTVHQGYAPVIPLGFEPQREVAA